MKYKRQKTKVSKYISLSDDKSKKSRLKKISLKRRSMAAAALVLVLFTLTRVGIISRSGARSVFVQNRGGIFADATDFVSDKLGFLNTAGETIARFCFGFLRNGETDKTSAYAEEEAPSDGQIMSDAQELPEPKAEFMFAPINPCTGRISSEFGERVHPLNSEVSFHNGLDIASSEGTEVRACFDGIVEKSEYNDYSGNYVIIRHEDDYTSSYAHLSKLLKNSGEEVKKGDVIGLVGSTGAATGPHLHFEIRRGGTPLNPKELIGMNN